MENFSNLTSFEFSSLSPETGENTDLPTFLERLAEAGPAPQDVYKTYEDVTYKDDSVCPTAEGFPGFQKFFEDDERCSSVETVPSANSVYVPSPATTVGDADLDVAEYSHTPADLDLQDVDTLINDDHELNANGKRDLVSPDDPVMTKKRKHLTGTYTRYANKPPYTYQGLIVTAIQNSRDKQLTLSGVQNWLKDHFEFFRGTYTGWKDSVRHNLSSSKCFYKETRAQAEGKPKRKLNYWKVDLSKITADVFCRQKNQLGKTGRFAPYIHEELGLPEVLLTANDQHNRESSAPQLPKTTSDNSVNVKLPKKFGSLHQDTSESPEVLRHSNSIHQKIDTPTSSKTGARESNENSPSNTTTEVTGTPQITPAICHILDYLSHTEKNSPSIDAVKNLSLLCGLSEDRLDLNTSFQEREEDKCSEKSPCSEEYSTSTTHSSEPFTPVELSPESFPGATDFSVSIETSVSNSFYPVLHQANMCNSQNWTSRYTSVTSNLYSHQEPVVLHRYPVVCYSQTLPTSNFTKHYAPSFTNVPTFTNNTVYVFDDEFNFGHSLVESLSAAEECSETVVDRLGEGDQTIKQDSAMINCIFPNTKDKLKLQSESSAFTEFKKE